MATHRPILSTGEIYHAYNRSVGNEPIFISRESLKKILEIIIFYRFSQTIRLSYFSQLPIHTQNAYILTRRVPLVEIYVFSFMPNHFHLLLRQLSDGGISKFISTIQNSFAKYYNLKNERDGGLFQTFKTKRVTTEEEFAHVSRYIHLNHTTSYLIEFAELLTYPWTSLPMYIGKMQNNFVETSRLLNHFKDSNRYVKFLADQVNYQRKLRKI